MEKVHIEQSPNDQRTYRYHVLPNGLPVLLVQQTDSEKSAASLTVNVGHFDDPAERQGLAHFLEHMLFLGSVQYPHPGEFQNFISHHGGSHNAWTGTEHSSFFFDIDNAFFEQALARFADMFCQPLFNPEYIEKERHAIEAEFSLKLKDDGRRIYQVHKETVNPAHPFAKFSVGNLNTLCDLPDSSLQQAVQQFYQQQYSSQRMTLALVSPLPLEVQLQLAEHCFKTLPNSLLAKPPLDMPLYLPQQQALQLNIQPHRHSQKLVVSFALPDITPWYRYKIVSFIAHLLGDEGEYSLLSYLKQQQLVNQLSAGGGIDGSNYKDFSVSFELTEKGIAARDTILEALFSMLALLREQPFPTSLFAERQKLLQWAFLYQEPSTAQQSACHLSVSMQHYPITDILYGDYRMELPPPKLYQHILAQLHPANMRIMLIHPAAAADRQALWYNTPYSIDLLEEKTLAYLATLPPNPKIRLPAANPYLLSELHLLPEQAHQSKPERFYQDDTLSVWYKADTEFLSPKGHIFLQLTLPNSLKDCITLAACRLWVELFQDQINQRFYAATTAGLTYHLHVQKQGISIHTCGLAVNQLSLLSDILQQLLQFRCQPDRFEEMKLQLSRHWANSSKNKPVSRLFSQLSALLQPLNPEIDQLAQALQQLSLEAFNQFQHTLLHRVHLESLLLGNWHTEDAGMLTSLLTDWRRQLPSTGTPLSVTRYNMHGLGPVWLQVDTEHTDHALVIYLPSQQKTPAAMACFMLANHLISPEYFHQLRTEQQLGYLVGTGYVPIDTLPGIAFYIQSPNTGCEQLYQATVTFFRAFLADIDTLEVDEFSDMKQGLQAQIKERDSSLSARAKRFWLAIGQGDENFSLTDEISSALDTLTLGEFSHFLSQLLQPSYDAIFLATDGNPQHSHLRFCSASTFRQQLQKN